MVVLVEALVVVGGGTGGGYPNKGQDSDVLVMRLCCAVRVSFTLL
jgi:hypothetical protein